MTVATYPAYSTTPVTWTYGSVGTGIYGNDRTMSGSDARWEIHSMRLNLAPGTYTLYAFEAPIYYASAAYCDAMRLVIWGGNTTAVTPVALSNGLTYIDMTASQPAGAGSTNFSCDLGSTVTFTVEAGVSYWFSMVWHGIAGRGGNGPIMRAFADGEWVLGDHWTGEVAAAVTAMPVTSAGWTYNDVASAVPVPRLVLYVKTAARTVYEVTAAAYAGSATEIILPRASGSPTPTYWIKFGNVVVANGQALTVVLEADAGNGNSAERATLVLDMGDTDQITFGGGTCALAAAGAETGDQFDIAINFRGATNKADVFYINKTTGQGAQGAADLVTISHAAKNNAAADGSRGQSYACTNATHSLKISGTATIASIQVGREMVVMFGDSQAIDSADRLASHVPGAFTYPHMYWLGAISGGCLSADAVGATTAGYLRYKHGTNGLGDLCEMRGVLFCVAGYGVNDISVQVGATEANRNKTVMLMAARLSDILYDVAVNGNSMMIIGLPPYSDRNASTEEALTIKVQWNAVLEGLAIGCRCAYVNPWHAMCQGGTSEAAIPTFLAAYTADGGLHYASAGSAVVAARVAQACETALVGGWWSRRRKDRAAGSLLPR